MSLAIIEDRAEFPATDSRDTTRLAGYLVVIEPAGPSWSAYVPDLPGVAAAADDPTEVRTLITEAIEFHLEGMRETGAPIPEPTARTAWVPK